MYATPNITKLKNFFKQNTATKPSSFWPQKKSKQTASLLVEYYSILFDKQYSNYFRPLKDLTLLFPTAETICISPSTNFILLPFPFPTYEQRTLQWRYLDNCPFLIPCTEANELVRDIDYSVDNINFIVDIKRKNPRQNYANYYPHTNSYTKLDRTNRPLDCEAKLWTYRFKDLPQKFTKDYWPSYSLSEIPVVHNLVSDNITFLEIPPIDQDHPVYHLKDIKVPLVDRDIYKYIDFNRVSETHLIRHFMKYNYNEFSPIQIRSGIKRLKNIIKYGAPISTSTPTPTPIPTTSSTAEPIRFNQHVRSLNIKQPDGTFKAQMIEDFNITNRTPMKNIEPLTLSPNDHKQNG